MLETAWAAEEVPFLGNPIFFYPRNFRGYGRVTRSLVSRTNDPGIMENQEMSRWKVSGRTLVL